MRGVMAMTACGMRVVGCFFVVSALVVFSCFAVVARGVGMVFCRVLVVFGCFLGHACSSNSRSSGKHGTCVRGKKFPFGPVD